MNKASQNTSKISQSTHKSIKALCSQSPFLIINTPCGVGKYKFNRIGYNNKDEIVLEYILVSDHRYTNSNIIKHNIGQYYYLSAIQVLYAFNCMASS